ncbi:condensin complex subunit 2 [Anoplophora glabripennis]|uniref:condensin complex subunit 2 n=1 Tax=Anoplophora glabripennis TaxID=217634 RepID=UPI00087544EE|nr:condensin complex subunit 2 [Anoplophora glabripennis]
METSTPLNRNSFGGRDLHRKTVMRNAMEVSPLRRRSIAPTPTISLENVNDEKERSSRRSLVDMQRRLSVVPHTASPLNEPNKFLGEQDMKDHFQICTKLFTENKITPKNAWKLHIIDLLNHITQKQGSDTLQVASTSLDISAKVYSIRVDDIHSDGLKLASSMSRVSDKQLSQNLDDQVDIGEADKENARPKKKKRKKRLLAGEKNTISRDPKTLQGPLPKLDTVFFSTRTDVESSAIDNLFTNRLKMDNLGYKFMLLSNEKAWTEQPDLTVQKLNDPNRKKYSLTVNPLANIKLCVPFSDFHVDDWDPDDEENQLALQKSSLMETQQEVIYDDNGIPMHELDGSIHDIFENPPDDAGDDIRSIHEEVAAQVRGEIANIVEFRPDITGGVQRSEYSYNTVVSTHSGKLIDRIWAGPSHWKLKFIKRASTKFSGIVMTQEKQVRGRRKAPPQKLDFDEGYEEFDMTKKLVIKKKPATVDINKITLPVPDNSCAELMEHIKELMIKAGMCPVEKKQVQEPQQVDYEVSVYNYENPNDSQYCSQHSDEPDAANIVPPSENHDDCGDIEEYRVAQQEFLGANLVDAPEMIPKFYVPYALQAKKMDMKKLKAAIWQNLTHSASKDNQERRGRVIPTTFSKMYKELPEILPHKMQKELSCYLAFIALLHLCNEQNLKLKQHLGCKDFDINGP